MTVNAVLAALRANFSGNKGQTSTLLRMSMIALLLGVLVTSCSHRHGDEHDHHAIGSEASHHHHDDGGPVELNNGEKWEADEHTLSVVEDMKSELSNFAKAGEEDYLVLADSLTHQLNVLIAGCTMEGAAHDELHKWLIPFTENVKHLAVAQGASDARRDIKEIEKSLDAFDYFFERKAN
jgi:hypothetical protein